MRLILILAVLFSSCINRSTETVKTLVENNQDTFLKLHVSFLKLSVTRVELKKNILYNVNYLRSGGEVRIAYEPDNLSTEDWETVQFLIKQMKDLEILRISKSALSNQEYGFVTEMELDPKINDLWLFVVIIFSNEVENNSIGKYVNPTDSAVTFVNKNIGISYYK